MNTKEGFDFIEQLKQNFGYDTTQSLLFAIYFQLRCIDQSLMNLEVRTY